jgi:hypothetical protein
MNKTLTQLVSFVVVALLIASFITLSNAVGASSLIPKEARTPALIASLTLAGFAFILLVLAIIFLRKGE